VPASVALSRHRPGRRTDAGRVSDAGVRSGGSLPGGGGKMLPRRPGSGLTLSNLRTRPLRGGGRVRDHGGECGFRGRLGCEAAWPMVWPKAWPCSLGAMGSDRWHWSRRIGASHRHRDEKDGSGRGQCPAGAAGRRGDRIPRVSGRHLGPRGVPRPSCWVFLGHAPGALRRVGTMTRVRVRHPVWRNRAAKCTAPEPFAGIGRLGPGLRARRLEPIAGGDERRAWKSRFDGTARRLAPDRPARYRTRQG